MKGMLRRLGLAAAVATAVALPVGAAAEAAFAPPRMVVDVDPTHPVFAGGVTVVARARGERAEILATVQTQESVAANRAATEALVQTLRSAVPELDVAGESTLQITPPGQLRRISGTDIGGSARVTVPAPLDDATLRRIVDRVALALSGKPSAALDVSARILNVAPGLASCVDLDRAGESAAFAEVDAIVSAVRTRVPGETALADRSWRPLPTFTDVLCGPEIHVRYAPRTHQLAPTSMLATERRVYGFSRTLAGALDAGPPKPMVVPETAVTWASNGVRLRVHAAGPVLTVAGFAGAHPAYAGGRYVWIGPSGSYRPADLHDDRLAEVRTRLHRLGVSDTAIVTQRDPASGRWFVEVRVAETEPREAVASAIAGDGALDRHEVRFLHDRVRCAPEAGDVRAAVADAAERAQVVALRLGTVADVRRPIAIDLISSTVEPCTTRETAPYDDRIVRHVRGSFVLPRNDGVVVVAMTARLRAFSLRGSAAPAPLSPPLDPNVERDQLAPPPVEYPAASTSAEARADATLPATHVLLTARFEPNWRQGEAVVDPSVPAAFAARIGASDTNAVSTLTPIPGYANDGLPLREWRTVALLDARPGLIEQVIGADAQANAGGHVWTDIVPERQTCGAAPVEVAVRAIRSAAALASKDPGAGRLVAVDLAGPYTLRGRCGLGAALAQPEGIRNPALSVRLAAYARVSFAAR
jgi:hypothetical protein